MKIKTHLASINEISLAFKCQASDQILDFKRKIESHSQMSVRDINDFWYMNNKNQLMLFDLNDTAMMYKKFHAKTKNQ